MSLACLLSSLGAHADIDPRFKSEAMPEGSHLGMAHTVVDELKSTAELTSAAAPQCLAVRSNFVGQRVHLRLQTNTFAMTKIPPFDDVREELWSRFVLEEDPTCSGWVMMSRTLGAARKNSVLDNWKRFLVNGSGSAQDVKPVRASPAPDKNLPQVGEIVRVSSARDFFTVPRHFTEVLPDKCRITENSTKDLSLLDYETLEIRQVEHNKWFRVRNLKDPSCTGWMDSSSVFRGKGIGGIAPQANGAIPAAPATVASQRQLAPQAEVALKPESGSNYCTNGPQAARVEVLRSMLAQVQLKVLDGPCAGVTGFVGEPALMPLKAPTAQSQATAPTPGNASAQPGLANILTLIQLVVPPGTAPNSPSKSEKPGLANILTLIQQIVPPGTAPTNPIKSASDRQEN